MLFLGVTRTRLRVTTTSILRTRAKSSYSTKGSGSGSGSSSNLMRYIAIASVVSTPGLWWLVSTRDDAARDDAPHLESPPAEYWGVEPGPSKDQVTRILSQGAYSFPVRNVAGVSRYDGAQLASNSPCEDRFTHGKLPSPWNEGNPWMAWAVFDGHSGWQTAELLKKQLLPFVLHSLRQVKPPFNEESLSEKSVQRATIKGFVSLDDSIIKAALDTSQSEEPLQQKVKKLAPAYAGSCALLSIYDSITSTLHVACTGDSRAVLGQKRPDGTWEAIPLSVDQTGTNKEEIARLHKEHPGEEDIVKNGRVLGIMVSRAFGDCQWKWPLEFQQDMQRRFYGPSPLTPHYDIRTPPYLTAEPVVTSTKIDPGQPSFLIMATDGLWDMLSNHQAVDLVGKWLESEAAEKRNSNLEPTYEPFDFGQFWNGVSWKFVEERTTVQDDNVAVHLVRNSLGGNHHELIAGRLAFSSPSSRRLRDDTTVQVVFFNVPDLKNN
ncbi:protein serine/threonine phosphatase 2C [Aspergillus campestris IBT 28561]|uniref:Protein serine/threonine phosphatase 2C n=1 Tax=Aspergillus campestris (strain IBT 28561) TaxID=1392248 RepID=A0A2I1D985_ASPC2|nr:protein serine/threonine phosphatase 2C [Aspergillus campestris IBT 28561]PKY06427.1 protein serine/threonine phosphatase 2C [Aspergillus campestris IBT 28561]